MITNWYGVSYVLLSFALVVYAFVITYKEEGEGKNE